MNSAGERGTQALRLFYALWPTDGCRTALAAAAARKVWDAFQKALSRDRARTNVTKISELGLVEMTRKRTRESLVQILTEPCPTCEGSGVVKSVTTVAYEILREVRRSGMLVDSDKIDIECAPRVAEVLSKQERDYLDHLEKRFQKLITVSGQKGWKPDQYRVAGKMSTEIAAEEAKAAAQLAGHSRPSLAAAAVAPGGAGNQVIHINIVHVKTNIQ